MPVLPVLRPKQLHAISSSPTVLCLLGCAMLLLCAPALVHGAGFVQRGPEIAGAELDEAVGSNVAIAADGTRIAIGASGHDNDGMGFGGRGRIRVYDWNGHTTNWDQLGSDIVGASEFGGTGNSLSMSLDGNRLAIGDLDAADTAQVRVLEFDGENWTVLGTPLELAGYPLFLSGNGLVLAVGDTQAGPNGNGQVRVFEWRESDWFARGDVIQGDQPGDQAGQGLALSDDGSRIAVGIPGADLGDSGFNFGKVRVFEWSGSTWVRMGEDLVGEAESDESGSALALSGDGSRLAIGAKENQGGGPTFAAGHVRVRQWEGGAWTLMGPDIDGPDDFAGYGRKVSLSRDGSLLFTFHEQIVDEETFDARTMVDVFRWDGEAWTQRGESILSDQNNDCNGCNFDVSPSGDLLVVGAQFHTPGSTGGAGRARVFEWSGTETCGDGTAGLFETCDDANIVDGDGCSSTCQNESSQSKAQQKCIKVLSSLGDKVASQQSREIADCFKDAANGKLATSVAECAVADRKGKLAKMAGKLSAAQDGEPDNRKKTKCVERPDFGWIEDSLMTEGITSTALLFAQELVGSDLDAVALSGDKTARNCQQILLKASSKMLATDLREFLVCQKGALAGGADTASDVGACWSTVGADAKGKRAKAADKFAKLADAKCNAAGVAFSTVAAGSCAGSVNSADFADCLKPQSVCAACQIINEMEGIGVDCDEIDDGQDNASCG
jgi:cysteine-rich repeat protein